MIRVRPSDAQRAEVLQRLDQGEQPGRIGLVTALHRKDVEAIATDRGSRSRPDDNRATGTTRATAVRTDERQNAHARARQKGTRPCPLTDPTPV